MRGLGLLDFFRDLSRLWKPTGFALGIDKIAINENIKYAAPSGNELCIHAKAVL